ncbi:SCP2 sterol-binding domain-containing protein [Burkholderia alba]|uniref:SCP2 sterol-binding domain-containing protein n=1 Tax=Burkholderia alba TaxID=2683677 RepID=UPI002B05AFEA|nr:SCP2 sterol-binding domain-containing protein [Burkholderia alba]
MTAFELLNTLPAAIDPQATAGLDRVLQFNISQPAYVSIRDGACEVTTGTDEAADLTLTLSDDDLVSLLTGKLDGMTAAMSGRLKLKGDLALAQQLNRYFDFRRLT